MTFQPHMSANLILNFERLLNHWLGSPSQLEMLYPAADQARKSSLAIRRLQALS
jgi:hypothetical protein